MIRKLRLRFILAALMSILFVLAATITAINSFNYFKIDNETAQSLDAVINYGHNGVYREYYVLTEEQKRWIEEEQQQQPEKSVYEDVLDFIKADYQVSVEGIKRITELMESGIFDITT